MSVQAERVNAGATWDAPVMLEPAIRFSAIVFGGDGREATARTDALAALGGQVARHLPNGAELSSLEDHAGQPLLIVDLTGEDEVSADWLDRVDQAASLRDRPLIVAFARAHIDLVAATCVRADAQLLCEPEAAEWIAALAIASRDNGGATLGERVGESESARLQRLNAEVARIAEVVARLSRQSEATRRRQGEQHVQPFTTPLPQFDLSAGQVREVIRARRLRDRFFEAGMFEDPAWDMLLDLLAAQLERAQVSVSSLCIAAAVPPTTALRWITKLTDAGLLEREADPFDKRRAYLKLSAAGGQAMQRYVAAVREAKLPMV